MIDDMGIGWLVGLPPVWSVCVDVLMLGVCVAIGDSLGMFGFRVCFGVAGGRLTPLGLQSRFWG